MNILLISPPYTRFMKMKPYTIPLGLGYIGAILKAEGHNVLIYDMDFFKGTDLIHHTHLSRFKERGRVNEGIENKDHPVWKELIQVVVDFSPDLIGVSIMTNKFKSGLRVASIVKNHNSNIPVIFGGHHPTLLPAEVLEDPNVDFVVRGEGEETVKELVQLIENGESYFGRIKGLSYKLNGEIFHNSPRPLISDLNTIPFPSRDLIYNVNSYQPDLLSSLVTSRGCPFGCKFCGVGGVEGRKVRFRSIENVLAEMEVVMDSYDTSHFMFFDNSFTVDKKRTYELCDKLISRDYKITWYCNTRFDLLDDALILKMKEAGCVRMGIGVESGTEANLKKVGKRITLDQIRQKAKMLNEAEIEWLGFFIIGLPHETKEEVMATVEFLKEVEPSTAGMSVFNPLPGTELFDQMQNEGMLPRQVEWKNYSQESLNNFMAGLSQEEFEKLVFLVAREFDEYNSKKVIEKLTKKGYERKINPFQSFSLKDISSILVLRSAPLFLVHFLLKELKDSFEDSKITVLAQPEVKDSLLENPYADEIFIYDQKVFDINLENGDVVEKLGEVEFDLCVILYANTKGENYENVRRFAKSFVKAKYYIGSNIEGDISFF